MNEKSNRGGDVQENIETENEKLEEVELSPEIVKEIESLGVPEQTKVILLLTASGIKPAMWLDLDPRIVVTPKLEDVISIMEKSHLKFEIERTKVREKVFEHDQTDRIDILMAHEAKNLTSLKDAINKNDGAAIGIALGFPKTAVDAYIRREISGVEDALDKEVLDVKKLPKAVRKSEAVRFCAFMLSKDNWREEVKQGQRYADLVKKISPTIYQEFMRWKAMGR